MKRLVLLGGGHAHVHVLQAMAKAPFASVQTVLVTPYARQMYSGMVPGLVAGHYRADECAIPLAPLAQAAGVPLIEASATHIDAQARYVLLSDGRKAEYDFLSVDTGAVMQRDLIPGAREFGLFVRPIEHFVGLMDGVLALAAKRSLDIVVLGAGAAGVELAMALQHRLAKSGAMPARVALVTGGPPPLSGYAPRTMARVAQALRKRRITVLPEMCVGIEAGFVLLANGARVACDVPLMAVGAQAPAWLAGSSLALNEQGFISTGPTLQSVSHETVFAVGDVATRIDVAHAKSGVYAVRAGPPLAENLRRALTGVGVGSGAALLPDLLPHTPPQRTLNLVSCGDQNAIASWGQYSAQGRWVWWLKNAIDRAFVRRYTAAPAAKKSLTPAA